MATWPSALVILLPLLISGCVFIEESEPHSPHSELDSLFLDKTPFQSFSITQEQSVESHGSTVSLLRGAHNGSFLDIAQASNLPIDRAYDLLDGKEDDLNSFFYDRGSPYPGPISNEIECPADFLPQKKFIENDLAFEAVYSLFSSKRLTFGVCAPDLAAYRATYALIYCKHSKKFYEIRYFVPLESLPRNASESASNISLACFG
jgi:hypothetical protein